MKNTFYLFAFLICLSSFGQKKKSVTTKSSNGLAKIENLIAEIKNENFQISITNKGKVVDTIYIKKTDKSLPETCKITPFNANGTKLYLVTWTEKLTTKTDLKSEDKTFVYSNIYELSTKKKVFFNTQLTNNIVEKVFLDRNKTASETQTRVRREGYEFNLNPDGTIIQKTAKQLNKWKYDAATATFVDAMK